MASLQQVRTTCRHQQGNDTCRKYRIAHIACCRLVPPVAGHQQLATVENAPTLSPYHRRVHVVAAGGSKESLYTQLPDRLDEPTPGFNSIASALQDLAAGVYMFVCL